jgi:hypothetical protein
LRWPSVEKGEKLQNLGEKLNINAKMQKVGENMQKKLQPVKAMLGAVTRRIILPVSADTNGLAPSLKSPEDLLL